MLLLESVNLLWIVIETTVIKILTLTNCRRLQCGVKLVKRFLITYFGETSKSLSLNWRWKNVLGCILLKKFILLYIMSLLILVLLKHLHQSTRILNKLLRVLTNFTTLLLSLCHDRLQSLSTVLMITLLLLLVMIWWHYPLK